MTRMRGVGAAAAVVVAVLVAGCGDDSGGETDAKPSASTVSPSPSEEDTVVPEETETGYPPTAAGDLDRKADAEGWTVDSYALASEFVLDVCEGMTDQDEAGGEPGESLARAAREGDNRKILKAGWAGLCPEWEKVGLAALDGDYVRTYPGGTYLVKAKPKDLDLGSDEPQEIGPGTYRTDEPVEDCYWERTTKGGDIIDNRFATSAQEITVTILLSDGQFTTEGCGTWKKVG
ncbi:hypothetical protein [Streptomyces lunaelactis]|uniref:hypothetical protein n=1 Tax=Streptomyces lunaelactis TaxID=1535768 RepID=UPI0015844900|nr:hypothetical protein [Streptomyces lunaelactis]NUK23683.1 hypothetical protein [Streptomyces lunaelactis]